MVSEQAGRASFASAEEALRGKPGGSVEPARASLYSLAAATLATEAHLKMGRSGYATYDVLISNDVAM